MCKCTNATQHKKTNATQHQKQMYSSPKSKCTEQPLNATQRYAPHGSASQAPPSVRHGAGGLTRELHSRSPETCSAGRHHRAAARAPRNHHTLPELPPRPRVATACRARAVARAPRHHHSTDPPPMYGMTTTVDPASRAATRALAGWSCWSSWPPKATAYRPSAAPEQQWPGALRRTPNPRSVP